MHKSHIAILGFLIFLLTCTGCENRQDVSKLKTDQLSTCADIYTAFFRNNLECSPILAEEGDVNDDGEIDLVLLYVNQDHNNTMCVLLRSPHGGYTATNEHKAPVSNQSVIFRNIDDKPPLEFIVQGMKGAKSGFAIYRIESGTLIDVFGEGMEDCC